MRRHLLPTPVSPLFLWCAFCAARCLSFVSVTDRGHNIQPPLSTTHTYFILPLLCHYYHHHHQHYQHHKNTFWMPRRPPVHCEPISQTRPKKGSYFMCEWWHLIRLMSKRYVCINFHILAPFFYGQSDTWAGVMRLKKSRRRRLFASLCANNLSLLPLTIAGKSNSYVCVGNCNAYSPSLSHHNNPPPDYLQNVSRLRQGKMSHVKNWIS